MFILSRLNPVFVTEVRADVATVGNAHKAPANSSIDLANIGLSQVRVLNFTGQEGITTIDIGTSTTLTELAVGGTRIATLDVSHAPHLTALRVDSNPALTELNASGTNIEALNLAGNTGLTTLNVASTNLTELILNDAPALTNVTANNIPTLTRVVADAVTNLGTLNLSNATHLNMIVLGDNIPESIDLAGAASELEEGESLIIVVGDDVDEKAVLDAIEKGTEGEAPEFDVVDDINLPIGLSLTVSPNTARMVLPGEQYTIIPQVERISEATIATDVDFSYTVTDLTGINAIDVGDAMPIGERQVAVLTVADDSTPRLITVTAKLYVESIDRTYEAELVFEVEEDLEVPEIGQAVVNSVNVGPQSGTLYNDTGGRVSYTVTINTDVPDGYDNDEVTAILELPSFASVADSGWNVFGPSDTEGWRVWTTDAFEFKENVGSFTVVVEANSVFGIYSLQLTLVSSDFHADNPMPQSNEFTLNILERDEDGGGVVGPERPSPPSWVAPPRDIVIAARTRPTSSTIRVRVRTVRSNRRARLAARAAAAAARAATAIPTAANAFTFSLPSSADAIDAPAWAVDFSGVPVGLVSIPATVARTVSNGNYFITIDSLPSGVVVPDNVTVTNGRFDLDVLLTSNASSGEVTLVVTFLDALGNALATSDSITLTLTSAP